jgi:hypothetical protein
VDVLRAVLGEERLNYAGYSYGTVLGTWYADLSPGGWGAWCWTAPPIRPWSAILVSACARAHENSYLIDGVLPAPGTVCRT